MEHGTVRVKKDESGRLIIGEMDLEDRVEGFLAVAGCDRP
jgi:hypothetical protein